MQSRLESPPAPDAAAAMEQWTASTHVALYDLLTSIAHELRQPLFAISASAEASLKWLERDAPNVEKAAQLARRIAQSASRADDILLHIQQTAAGQPPARDVLDLGAVTQEACAVVRDDAEARRVELMLDLAEDLPRVIGDRVEIQQIVVNLLVNAVQAIDEAGSELRRVTLRTSLGEDGAPLISVLDTGPGVPEIDLQRIFTRCYTTKPDGMGLGLALCRRLAQSNGGDIRASNNPEGGARFDVSFAAAS